MQPQGSYSSLGTGSRHIFGGESQFHMDTMPNQESQVSSPLFNGQQNYGGFNN